MTIKKYPIYISKKNYEDTHVDLLLVKKKTRKITMFFLKILLLSCMIILYIEKKIFLQLFFKSFDRGNIKTSH